MTPEPTGKKSGDWRSVVTLDRRALVAILVGVCILSSAIGAGIGLIAETGPAGPTGERGATGPEGPEGPEGPSGASEVDRLEGEVEELRGRVEEGEGLASAVEELEAELGDLSGITSELCSEIDAFC